MEMRTPFHHIYAQLGARFIDVRGWQVAGGIDSTDNEYLMIRERVGFSEYHFQGCFGVCGSDAFKLLQSVLVADLNKITPGATIYSSILDSHAKLIDDVIVFWLAEDRFIIHGGIARVACRNWLLEKSEGLSAWITDLSNTFLSIQGPKSAHVLQKVVDIADLGRNRLIHADLAGVPVIIARVGFSGELGYEVHFAPEFSQGMWDLFTNHCAEYGGGPYGLMTAFPISTDTGLLFGDDFYSGGTPLEYGLGWSVAFDKGDFFGRDEMLRRREAGLRTKLVGFEVRNAETALSAGQKILHNGEQVGETTIGWNSPVLKRNLGRGWVKVDFADEGTLLHIESENGLVDLHVAKSYRFYDPKGERVKTNVRSILEEATPAEQR